MRYTALSSTLQKTRFFKGKPYMMNPLVNIERCLYELKCGRPVILRHENHDSILVVAAENVTNSTLADYFDQDASLVLAKNRLAYLNLEKAPPSYPIATCFDKTLWQQKDSLLWQVQTGEPLIHDYTKASTLQTYGLQLVALAELLPTIITASCKSAHTTELLALDAETLDSYEEEYAQALTIICETPITLKNAPQSKITAFRAPGYEKEHLAITIGTPGDTPIIRIHSSCYTGDLLNSLECDCSDQLHAAIEYMAQQGGGVILYLMQEGRGIGLINKLRAYHLKRQGLDTVDANLALGFDDDKRSFQAAAAMLQRLNIQKVKLLTNNPRKSEGLEACGIDVVECVSHTMEPHQHNKEYLKTKAARLGHRLPKNTSTSD